MTSNRTRKVSLLAVLAVAVMLVAATPLAVSAATTTLAGDGTDEITNFAADSNDHLEYSLSSSGTDFGTDGTTTVKLNVSHDSIDHFETSTTDIADADTSYNFNVSHAELDTVPGEPGETTTVNVTAWGTDGSGTITTGATEFAVDLVFDDSRNVIYVADGNQALTVEEPEEPGMLASTLDTLAFWSEDDDEPDVATIESTRTISGSSTTITAFDADDNASDAFSTAAEDYTESADPVLGMTVTVDDSPVPVFYESADEDIVDNTSDTYAVYDGEKTEIELGDDYNDSTSADIYVESQNVLDSDADVELADLESAYNDELSVSTLLEEFDRSDVGLLRWAGELLSFSMLGGGLLAGGLVIGLRRRDVEV